MYLSLNFKGWERGGGGCDIYCDLNGLLTCNMEEYGFGFMGKLCVLILEGAKNRNDSWK